MPSLPANEVRTINEVPHTVFLAPESWVLLLSAFEFLDNLGAWSGAGAELTASEIDDIQALVAQTYEQVMMSQVGSVQWLAGACPLNMLVCDGASYLRVDYPALYDFLDSAFIVDGSNFSVPDLRGAVSVGVSATLVTGATGGSAAVTLSTSEIPGHTHSVFDAGHTHVEGIAVPMLGVAGPVPSALPAVGATAMGYASINETSVGGDGAHENMQPYLVLLPCIVAL